MSYHQLYSKLPIALMTMSQQRRRRNYLRLSLYSDGKRDRRWLREIRLQTHSSLCRAANNMEEFFFCPLNRSLMCRNGHEGSHGMVVNDITWWIPPLLFKGSSSFGGWPVVPLGVSLSNQSKEKRLLLCLLEENKCQLLVEPPHEISALSQPASLPTWWAPSTTHA